MAWPSWSPTLTASLTRTFPGFLDLQLKVCSDNLVKVLFPSLVFAFVKVIRCQIVMHMDGDMPADAVCKIQWQYVEDDELIPFS